MKLQNMKRGETTEQIALFNWAMRSTRFAVPFPHVSRSKRGETHKRPGA